MGFLEMESAVRGHHNDHVTRRVAFLAIDAAPNVRALDGQIRDETRDPEPVKFSQGRCLMSFGQRWLGEVDRKVLRGGGDWPN